MIQLQEFKKKDKSEDNGYLTHSLHTFPAKFPPFIPRFILEKYSKANDLVLDPFCGSGTTLVEARLLKMHSIGIDVNGLACLISKVKTTKYQSRDYVQIRKIALEISVDDYKKTKNHKTIQFSGIEHWFQNNVIMELSYILEKISSVRNHRVVDFLKIVLSSIIVRVSNQESDTRFVAINKNIQDGYTINCFKDNIETYLEKIIEYSNLVSEKYSVTIHNADSRNLSFIANNSVDIIITSPPYANTYDYYLYHKFRKKWLGIDVEFAQYNEIGSRREYSSLKMKTSKWIEDLTLCLNEMKRVLKKGKLAFIVIGDSVINKKIIKMDREILRIANKIGFTFETSISTKLEKHSKLFNPSFAKKGKKEHLIALRKSKWN